VLAGLMLHHQDGYYQDGRSTNLFKLKKYQGQQSKSLLTQLTGQGQVFIICWGLCLVELDDGLQFKIGSGFNDLQRKIQYRLWVLIVTLFKPIMALNCPEGNFAFCGAFWRN